MSVPRRIWLTTLLLIVLSAVAADCIDFERSDVKPPVSPEETIHRAFTWAYQGTAHQYAVEIPNSAYQYYRDQPHTGANYVRYALSAYDRAQVREVAAAFTAMGEAEGYTRAEQIENVIAFVQSLAYTSDQETIGSAEYPRYPLETLADDGGDCEDAAILIASILHEMGVQTALLKLPEHIAVGISGDDLFTGTHFLHNSTRYFYLETTSG